MNRILAVAMMVALVLSLMCCGQAASESYTAETIQTYEDIPGITEEDITAIEALKASRSHFTFGQMAGTEAFFLADGIYAGFSAKVCELLSNLFGIEFSLELFDWESLKSGIDNGEIDFTGDLTPTAERMRQYYMTHPIAERSLRIFTCEKAKEINTEKDINGLRIGSLSGTIDMEQVLRYYPELLFSVVEVESLEDVASLLQSGEIDAFISEGVIDPFFDEYGFIESKEFFPLVYTSVALATANRELKPVIDVFNQYLAAGGIDVLYEYYKAGNDDYARHKLTKSFTQEERAWLSGLSEQGISVKVALERDNYPVSFYNEKEQSFQGIAVDVLTEINRMTGIRFETVNDEHATWAEVMEMLRKGEVSLISQLLVSDGRKGDFLWAEKPYDTSTYALLSKFDYPNIAGYQVVRAKVGAVNETAYEDKYYDWFPDSENLILYENQIALWDALEAGDIDLLMGSDYFLMAQQNYREKPGYKINIRFTTPLHSYFGFNVNEALLCSVIDKAQPYVDVVTISTAWTNRGYDYAKTLARQRSIFYMAIAGALALLLLLTGYFLYKHRMLNLTLDKKVEEAVSNLEKAQITMSAMFSLNPQMNILFDSDFHVIDCNPAAMQFLGFRTKEEMLNGFFSRIAESIPDFQSDGRKSIALSERLSTAVNESRVQFETEFFISDEARILSVEMIRIPYGDNCAIVGYIVDMTEIHEREAELIRRDEQLSEAVEEARAANNAKSDFLSNMSHEIRTPLNAILGITEILLENENLELPVKEAMGNIYSSGDLLLGIINDILDLSKIEAGKIELFIEKYEVAGMVSDAAQLNVMRIGSKPIAFNLDVDETMPSVLIGDELRIKQIMNNLLSNAFKYTAKGIVNLAVSAEATEEDKGRLILVIRVSDTGQGMSEEQVARLFDQYVRFNQQANRTTEGTGLGMSITRNLVSMMEGQITVESEPGKGSVFTVRLPQGDAGAGPLGKEMTDNPHQFHRNSRAQMKRVQIIREPMPYGSVLIVDDVETNTYVAKGLLTPYGLKIDCAGSGYEAIEMIKDGKVYDIVFMDHMMPEMDGMETTKILRESGYGSTIVALTANAVIGQSDLFLSNGFDDFLSKPIDIRQLNTVVNKYIRDKQPPEVLEKTRRQAEEKAAKNTEGPAQATIDPVLAESFVRDANKSLAILEEIMAKHGNYDEADMRNYIIHVHGMKSALANIGYLGISAVALKLEQVGREGNKEAMVSETQAFLDALRTVVETLSSKDDHIAPEEEDTDLLGEKLREVEEACEALDKRRARRLIAELRGQAWQTSTGEMLSVIAGYLLHSDFERIKDTIDRYIGAQK